MITSNYYKKLMRRPGIEPGAQPWQGRIIPFNHQRKQNEELVSCLLIF